MRCDALGGARARRSTARLLSEVRQRCLASSGRGRQHTTRTQPSLQPPFLTPRAPPPPPEPPPLLVRRKDTRSDSRVSETPHALQDSENGLHETTHNSKAGEHRQHRRQQEENASTMNNAPLLPFPPRVPILHSFGVTSYRRAHKQSKS